jgi:hypothetical protein
MTTIEDRLRASLAAQVRTLRIGEDMAGTAIRSGRAIRRRRLAMVTAACAVAVALVACVRPTPNPGPSAPEPGGAGEFGTVPVTMETGGAAQYGLQLDLLDATGQLRTTDGHRYDLSGARIRYLDRVPAGWVFGREADDRAWLLRPDGTTVTLRARTHQAGGEQPWRPVVSADGLRLAWVDGGTAYAARLTADGERDLVASPIGPDAFAWTWIGNRVVLGQTYEGGCCGYNHAQYDVWDPAKGDFVPHWTRQLGPIYGPVPDGAAGFAAQQIQPPAAAACLVRLDAVRDLSATAKACPAGLLVGSLQTALGPDGRYLFQPIGSAGTVFDLSTVVPAGQPAATCPGGWALAWEDATHVLILTDQHGVRCDVTTGAATPIDAGIGNAGDSLRVVPRYGVRS